MREGDSASEVIRQVARGERFALTGDEPSGAYYRVRDRKTGSYGWLNANHCRLIKSAKPSKKRSRK